MEIFLPFPLLIPKTKLHGNLKNVILQLIRKHGRPNPNKRQMFAAVQMQSGKLDRCFPSTSHSSVLCCSSETFRKNPGPFYFSTENTRFMCAGTQSCFPTPSLSLSSMSVCECVCVFICVCVFDGRLCLHGKWEGAAGMLPEGKESALLPRFSPEQHNAQRKRERKQSELTQKGTALRSLGQMCELL